MAQAERERPKRGDEEVSRLAGLTIVRQDVTRTIEQAAVVATSALRVLGPHLDSNDVARQILERAADSRNIKAAQAIV